MKHLAIVVALLLACAFPAGAQIIPNQPSGVLVYPVAPCILTTSTATQCMNGTGVFYGIADMSGLGQAATVTCWDNVNGAKTGQSFIIGGLGVSQLIRWVPRKMIYGAVCQASATPSLSTPATGLANGIELYFYVLAPVFPGAP